MIKVFKGNVISNDTVIESGYVSVADGKIIAVGTERPDVDNVIDVGNDYIVPGFIDIHCHSSHKNMAESDVDEVADFHLSKGTTTLILSLYRNIPHDELLVALNKIKTAMKFKKNLYGAHLEGPYLSSKYGTGLNAKQLYPDKKLYQQYFDTGIVRQTTCAPEVEGVSQYIVDAVKSGVVVSLGHSQASYEQVKNAYELGASIETHTFDATGTTIGPKSLPGTLDMSFDQACMLMDNMYYEVICDSEWVHVRKEMLALLIKTVGIDRVVGITDCYKCDIDDDRDINVINEKELCGSKLTMDRVAKNLFNAGYSFPEIVKMTAKNAAMAVKAFDRGEIAVDKKADLIRLNSRAEFIEVLSLA